MESIELNNFWRQVKAELLRVLPENAHPWVHPLEISGFDNGVLTVVTGQIMGRDFLKKNYYSQIVEVIKEQAKLDKADFVIIFDSDAAKSLKKENDKLQKKAAEAALKEQAMENLSYMQSSANLNLKYKFENFVVGDSNKFAYYAAKSVAENPAKKYNPLFIYGAAGLGKTHLMQAIGHYILFNNPELKVKYVKTVDYINDFVSNCRNGNGQVENMSKFNKKYTNSNIGIILIDDIQFIESKMKTMNQLHQTFEALYNKGKQIVITSDRQPKEIPTLTKALSSRFEMGLMVELVPPDEKTRYEILKKLASDNDIKYEEEALKYITKHFRENVRELEGAFNRVCAYAELMKRPLSLDLAKEILRCDDSENEVTFDKIAEVTANYFNVSLEDLKGPARGQKIAAARHMAVYLSREVTGQSFPNIAEYFNKKHTTIMFAHEKIRKTITSDKTLTKAAREIKQALKLI